MSKELICKGCLALDELGINLKRLPLEYSSVNLHYNDDTVNIPIEDFVQMCVQLMENHNRAKNEKVEEGEKIDYGWNLHY